MIAVSVLGSSSPPFALGCEDFSSPLFQQVDNLSGYLALLVRGDHPDRHGRAVGADSSTLVRAGGPIAFRVETDTEEFQVAEYTGTQGSRPA
jgi:hypothetical protein